MPEKRFDQSLCESRPFGIGHTHPRDKSVDTPVGGLFIGLTLIYISDFFASLGSSLGMRALGFFHLGTGGWLMYLTWATVLNITSGYHLWV